MSRRIRTAMAALCLAVTVSALVATAATPAAAAAPTTTATATTADPYCKATIMLVSQWSSGYAASITVQNVGVVPVRWRLVLRFVNPPLSVQVWNATYTQSGLVATIVPTAPYGVLQPGQSVLVGFVAASGTVVVLPQAEVTCTPV